MTWLPGATGSRPRSAQAGWARCGGAADLEAQLDADGGWSGKTVEHRVAKVRKRPHRQGVRGLVASEVDGPSATSSTTS
ncbi:hypothetical protein [Pseudonocardia zijingensis]|uniref:hypothetical protein n=1 Tax=Pseudonocardia zijingensis TaxID=153376 RepID=UPI0031E425D8